MCWKWSVITCNLLRPYWVIAASSSGQLLWSKMLQDLCVGSCKFENLQSKQSRNSWVILLLSWFNEFCVTKGLGCVPCKQHHWVPLETFEDYDLDYPSFHSKALVHSGLLSWCWEGLHPLFAKEGWALQFHSRQISQISLYSFGPGFSFVWLIFNVALEADHNELPVSY